MASRWACPHCEFAVWAKTPTVAGREAAAHLSAHFGGVFSETVFKTTWTCPACDEGGAKLDRSEAMASFQSHLLDHVADRIADNPAVVTERCQPASVLFLTPDDRRGLSLIRRWMALSADTVVSATRTPSDWIRILSEPAEERPKRLVLLTPAADSLDLRRLTEQTDTELEVVDLGDTPNVGELGKTVAATVDEQASADGHLAIEFDLLPRVMDACDGSAAFRFLHLLDGVFEEADAFAVVPLNPATVPDPTIGVFVDLFDDVLYGEDDRLKRFVMAKGRPVGGEEVPESTYSETTPPNQRVVPTGPDKYRYR